MPYDRLYIFVEGRHDKDFFEKIIKPELEKKWHFVRVFEYAEKSPKEIRSFLKNVQLMKADYIYVVDNDQAICITTRAEKILNKVSNLDRMKIQIVVEMIEGWYLAGLNKVSEKKLKMMNLSHTNQITKQQFNHLRPKKFRSQIDFMHEILNHYSIEIARQKNASFNYFFDKYCT